MAGIGSGFEYTPQSSGTAASNTLTLLLAPPSTPSVVFAAFTQNNFGGGGIATPSGWTLVGSQSFVSGGRATFLFAREYSSSALTSVAGTAPTATGIAGAAVAVTGISLSSPFSTSVASNVGTTSSGANYVFDLDATTAFPNEDKRPSLVVSALGANATLATATYPNLGFTPTALLDQVVYQTGQSNSTSIALGLFVAAPDALTLPLTPDCRWDLGVTTPTRSAGIVSAIYTGYSRGLSSVGVGA